MRSKTYDLMMVVTSFRACCSYLSITKDLSKNYSIGIFLLELSEKDKRKTDKTNLLFKDLLIQYGAHHITSKVQSKILILPQWPYSKEQISQIKDLIVSKKNFWLTRPAMGNYSFENLYDLKIHKVLITDKRFYNQRLGYRPYEKINSLKPHHLVETGLPYKKIPIFDKLNIDYIIANPTPHSFKNQKNKLIYLDNVLTLLDKIPNNSLIAMKPHNAIEDTDSLLSNKIHFLFKNSLLFRTFFIPMFLLKILLKAVPSKKIELIYNEFLIYYKYRSLLKRIKHLKEITKYYQLNLELFLPFTKGLITGRSNSIWYSLFFKVPVYNCSPDEPFIKIRNLKIEEKGHPYNMQYFNVKCCNGEFNFDERRYNIIENKTRNINITNVLKKYL